MASETRLQTGRSGVSRNEKVRSEKMSGAQENKRGYGTQESECGGYRNGNERHALRAGAVHRADTLLG